MANALTGGIVMTRHQLFRLIKFLMMSAPLLSLVMMVLALWGVVGKTTYPDLNTTKKGITFGAEGAENYLVNETKNIKQCPEQLKSADIGPKGEKPMTGKMDWEHIV